MPVLSMGLLLAELALVLAILPIVAPTLGALQEPRATEPALSPQFETISIRPAAESPRGTPESPDRYISPNTTLAGLIEFAYDVQRSQVVGGEPWTRSMRFDVEAKAAQAPTADVKRAMVRSLLAQRFGLRVTAERRQLPVFVLSRSGRRLRPNLTMADEACLSGAALQPQSSQCRTLLQAKPGPSGLVLLYKAAAVTMTDLASWLSPYAGRYVVDRTGLPGRFAVSLSFAPGNGPLTDAPSDAPPSVFTAVREQLGLALRADAAPVEVIVIQSAQLPTDN